MTDSTITMTSPSRAALMVRRGAWVLAPLLTVAWYAAPEWPARVAMLPDAQRNVLYPWASNWTTLVASVDQALPWSAAKDSSSGVAPSSALSSPKAAPLIPSVEPVAPTPLVDGASDTAVTAQVTSSPTSIPNVSPTNALPTVDVSADHGANLTPTQNSESHSSPPAIPTGPHGTMLAIGDSLMEEVASGMKDGLPTDLKVDDAYKVSTGMANQGYYNWPVVAQQKAEKDQPDWVIFHMGGNDSQDMLVNKRWIHFGSDEWKTLYVQRVESMVDNVRAVAPHVKMVWIGLPAMRDGAFNAKMAIVSEVQQAACQARGIPYVDGHQALGETYKKEGTFDGRHRVWRADDGVHYSREGGRLLARLTAKDPRLNWDWSDTRR